MAESETPQPTIDAKAAWEESLPIRDLPDYETRMAAARARAQWDLGDPSWAGRILAAFMHPTADAIALAAEKDE
jgi:hypothetical protein